MARQLQGIEPKQRGDQEECWITYIIDSDRKVTQNVTRIADMQNSKCKSQQQNGKKNVGSALSHSFVIQKEYNKYGQDDTSVA